MPYVNVPNDLSKIKTKMAFNLTKRQLVCFGSAGAVGIPAYLLTRGTLGNTGAMFLMLGIMLPAFLLAMYAHSDCGSAQGNQDHQGENLGHRKNESGGTEKGCALRL